MHTETDAAPVDLDMPGSVHVAIVDDHPGGRGGYQYLCDRVPCCKVVMHAVNGQDFIDQLATVPRVDVVLVDMLMPVMDGAALMSWLRENRTDIRALATSFIVDEETQLKAVRSGARGFFPKGGTVAELDRAMRHLMLTGRYHTDELHALLLQNPGGITPLERERMRVSPLISARELEVMDLMSQWDGYTNKEIADKLHLSKRTVDNHIKSVCDVLRTPNRTAAVVKLLELGILRRPGSWLH